MNFLRRNLLWIDSLAGLTVGLVTLIGSGWLAQWYGLPIKLILIMSLANFVYGTYSCFLARRSARPAKFIRGYFKTCSGLRQKSQLAFKTKGILANPTTMIARF